MGGNSATTQQETTTAATGFPSSAGTYQMQAAPPGMLDQIAAAIAAGYGGGQNAQRSYLDSIYSPTTFASYSPVGQQITAPKAAAAQTQTGGLGASSWRAGIDPVGMPQS
jgi:hypothetical protein